MVFFPYVRERKPLVSGHWELEDDPHEMGTRKVPLESRISSCGSSDKDGNSTLKESSSARWLAKNSGMNFIPLDCDDVGLTCAHTVKCERRLTGGEVFGEELRDLEALTSAIRSRRWTFVSTKLSCLPFESYLERGMSVEKAVAKYEGNIHVLDIMTSDSGEERAVSFIERAIIGHGMSHRLVIPSHPETLENKCVVP